MRTEARILANHRRVAARWLGIRENAVSVGAVLALAGIFAWFRSPTPSPIGEMVIVLAVPLLVSAGYLRLSRVEVPFLSRVAGGEAVRTTRLIQSVGSAIVAFAALSAAGLRPNVPGLGNSASTGAVATVLVVAALAQPFWRRSGSAATRLAYPGVGHPKWTRSILYFIRATPGSFTAYIGVLALVNGVGVFAARANDSASLGLTFFLAQLGLTVLMSTSAAIDDDAALLSFDPRLGRRLWKATWATWALVVGVQAGITAPLYLFLVREMSGQVLAIGVAVAVLALAYTTLVRLAHPRSELRRSLFVVAVAMPLLVPVLAWSCLRRLR